MQAGKKISIDFNYFFNNLCDSFGISGRSYNPDQSLIPNSYYANINRNNSKITNYSAKIDLELPLKWINLNLGGKVAFTENKNNYVLYDYTLGNLIVDNNQTNIFRYKENVQSVYISANKQITEKFQIQAGLRMENAVTEGYSETMNQTDKNCYLKLFPTGYLLYKFNNDFSIAFNYSRRINRPYYYDLNPYKVFDNAYSYREGNPFLKPSFSNNLELSLTTPDFEHRIWYSSISGDKLQFPFVDTLTQIVRHYPVNCINYFSTGLSESYTFNKIGWWNSFNNTVIYYIHKTASISEAMPLIHKISANFSTNNDFMLNKKRTVILNVGFYYELPHLDAYSNVEAYGYVYAGIRARLLKDNLTLALTVNDLFKTNHARQTVLSNDIRYVYDDLPDSRYVRLSISYKFGNKQIWTEKRNVGNEEERGRLR